MEGVSAIEEDCYINQVYYVFSDAEVTVKLQNILYINW